MKKPRFLRYLVQMFRTYLMPPLRRAFNSGVALARDVLLAELQAMLQRLSPPVAVIEA